MSAELRTADTVLREIQEFPERHIHIHFEQLQACAMVAVDDGGRQITAIDLRVLDAHEAIAPFGWNGGRKCDVAEGPCACGAWHRSGEKTRPPK